MHAQTANRQRRNLPQKTSPPAHLHSCSGPLPHPYSEPRCLRPIPRRYWGQPPSGSNPLQTETALNDESLLETVFSQSDPGNRGCIMYYRDKVTDILYMRVYYISGYAGSGAGAGGLTVMLEPGSGKPLTYTRYMEMYSALNS